MKLRIFSLRQSTIEKTATSVSVKTPLGEIERRLKSRNVNNPENNHYINEEMLEEFSAKFEVPHGEGEQVVEQ